MKTSRPKSSPQSDGDAPVSRRNLFARLAVAVAAGGAAFRASAAETGDLPKVAYGVSDVEKVSFALSNIANHIEGMGGPDKVHIVLVVNGPALGALRADRINPDVTRKVESALNAGVTLGACANTMAAQKITVADLVPGFVAVDEGGVTRLAKLQAEGYAYIRP